VSTNEPIECNHIQWGIIMKIIDFKQALENTEGTIKYRQSRETGNIGYTRHNTKTNQAKTK
jgi:hypothetical protein